MSHRLLPAHLCVVVLCAAASVSAGEGLPSEVRFERAKVMVLKGDAAGAEKELDALLAADPGFAPAKYLLGQVLFMKREYARAAAMFDAYLKAEPSSAPCWYWSCPVSRGRSYFSKSSLFWSEWPFPSGCPSLW